MFIEFWKNITEILLFTNTFEIFKQYKLLLIYSFSKHLKNKWKNPSRKLTYILNNSNNNVKIAFKTLELRVRAVNYKTKNYKNIKFNCYRKYKI